MAGHQQRLGAGVIIGSNVFNLAALLGLGAVVAGRVRPHRKVVVLGGAMAMYIALVCLAVVPGLLPAVAGLVLTLAAVVAYGAVLGLGQRGLGRLPLPPTWIGWLRRAMAEEEIELEEAIKPEPARRQDVAVAAAALLVVVLASVTMERAVSALGSRFAIPEIIVGGLVLAAVTSLPNAAAAVYLAARGRGAATLSTAPEQQHPERHDRPAGPGRDHRPGPADGPGYAHRRVVPGADRPDAGVRLPRPRHQPGDWPPRDRRLPGLHRLGPGVGLRGRRRCPAGAHGRRSRPDWLSDRAGIRPPP
jgi:hypothetical protein